MKWESIHPAPGNYRFDQADRFVEYGERHGMFIVGHTLVWHNQTPRWVFQNEDGSEVDRDTLLERMREHIHTVVGRYKGRVHGWDVVNEALKEDGTLRDSAWRRIIGDDYIIKAFQFAHEADADAQLYYNDFGIENRAKARGAVRIIRSLQEAGVPVHAVGVQEHINLTWPSVELLDETLSEFASLGVKIHITELDIDPLPYDKLANEENSELFRENYYDPALDPYRDGLTDEMQQRLAERYAEIFRVYMKHDDAIERVTFWGITDGATWLNDFPIPRRINHPLLFDRQGNPKPAYEAVMEVAREAAK